MIPIPEQLENAPRWKQTLFRVGLVMVSGCVAYNLIDWVVG